MAMKNLTFGMPLVDGEWLPIEFENGRELIHRIWGDDFAAPPVSLIIEANSESGKKVRIVVPYDDRDRAHVEVSD
jgi:hypothetical protein